MRRALVVEAIAVALMADGVDAFGKLGVTLLRRRFRRLPIGIVGGMGRVLREGVQDVGEHQLLMLLLVVQSDLQNARDFGPRRTARFGDQRFNRRIDVRAVLRDLGRVRPRDQSTFGPRMARAGGDVIRVEQKREALIVNPVGGHVRLNQKRLEEPGRVRAMPLGRACVRHRLDRLILRRKRHGAALGLAAHAAERLDPAGAILALGRGLLPEAGRRSTSCSPRSAAEAIPPGIPCVIWASVRLCQWRAERQIEIS